jgi:hypothetical protein
VILDEVGALLEAGGHGVVKTAGNDPAWPIHKGALYDGTAAHPDDAIALIVGPGSAPITEMGGVVAAEVPSLVVQVRSRSYSTAHSKAAAIWTALHMQHGNLSGTTYYLMEARQSPMPLGRDENSRWLVGFNVDVTKERS